MSEAGAPPESGSSSKAAMAILLALALVVVGIFATNCSDRGTVLRSLNDLGFYDYVRVSSGIQVVYRPAEVTNSHAYRTILGLGDDAVPGLQQALSADAEWRDANERWAAYRSWLKEQQRLGRLIAPPKPRTYPEFQRHQKTAAGVMLLVLGTNHGAGFAAMMEACASIIESDARQPKTGPQGGITPGEMVRIACSLAPGQREEIVDGIIRGLQHTNVFCRFVAANSSRRFPERNEAFAPLLLQRLNDINEWVQMEALFSLTAASGPANRHSQFPAALDNAIRAVISNTNNSPRLRDTAQALLKQREN